MVRLHVIGGKRTTIHQDDSPLAGMLYNWRKGKRFVERKATSRG